MATNVFFSPKVRTEQYLYEDITIEALKMYGQDVYYIPRTQIHQDEILNDDYSKYEAAYQIEMYIANTEGFEGEGTLMSKFGLEIRDQATFVVARRRFQQLVDIDANDITAERPREGDLIYLPLSNSLFEIKFVEHERPFYQLSNLPTYELQCEMFEYASEEFNTNIAAIDQFENLNATQDQLTIKGGIYGFAPGDTITQIVVEAESDVEEVYISAEVTSFTETVARVPGVTDREGLLVVSNWKSSDGTYRSFLPSADLVHTPTITHVENPSNTGWSILEISSVEDDGYLSYDAQAQNTEFENWGDDIIDFSESNPFGDPTTE